MTSAIDGRWHPGIGDPNVTGWVTVGAYTLAMLLCYLCHSAAAPSPERRFWLVVTLLMAVFGVNKQLDLQTWFTEVGRDLALQQGWYQRRRFVQGIFIFFLMVGLFWLRAWLGIRLGNLSAGARQAGVGLVLLAAFVVMRASSFHHVDAMLGLSLANVRVNVVLEISAISVIAWAAVRRLRDSSTLGG
ncbi:MAG: hypothetical protein IPN53_01390 [Comamonadaceae bacterium]|nr:hypothetical protein [Comamonadaceae bacterium]